MEGEDVSNTINATHATHPPLPPPTLVAPRFEDAKIEHLLALISDMIDRLIVHNDQIPLQPDALTRFHSRSPPGISVCDYLARIVRYANVERSCLLITLHYIDQICARLPKFTITSLTIHRFIIASVTVSSKALCDVFCTNSRYAQVGGIKPNELNLLEREFLNIIDWRLFCTGELLQQYYANLVRTHSKGAYKLDIEASPLIPLISPDDDDDGGDPADVDEADSTAHPTSCAASITTAADGEMRSDSESVADDEEPMENDPGVISPTGTVLSGTPRSAAKRRAESTERALELERLRPRGRRRLDDK